MGEHAVELVPPGARLLTHCNTGALATGGFGSALGAIRAAWDAGLVEHVWVDETRPLLQGARLTAWELEALGIPFAVHRRRRGGVAHGRGARSTPSFTGADRIAANGDVANKVGTYGLAVAATHHGIPFYVVAPTSTLDPSAATGADIPIEERDPAEVTRALPGAQSGVRRHARRARLGDRDRGGRASRAVRRVAPERRSEQHDRRRSPRHSATLDALRVRRDALRDAAGEGRGGRALRRVERRPG